jgi:hypothetical protein
MIEVKIILIYFVHYFEIELIKNKEIIMGGKMLYAPLDDQLITLKRKIK